jgi:hypothetical protein
VVFFSLRRIIRFSILEPEWFAIIFLCRIFFGLVVFSPLYAHVVQSQFAVGVSFCGLRNGCQGSCRYIGVFERRKNSAHRINLEMIRFSWVLISLDFSENFASKFFASWAWTCHDFLVQSTTFWHRDQILRLQFRTSELKFLRSTNYLNLASRGVG